MQLLQTLEGEREGELWRRSQWLPEVPLGCPGHTQSNPCPRQDRGYSNHHSKCAQTTRWGSQLWVPSAEAKLDLQFATLHRSLHRPGHIPCLQLPLWPTEWPWSLPQSADMCSQHPSHRGFVHRSRDVTCITSVLPCNIRPTVKWLKERKKENPLSKITSGPENYSCYLHLLANAIT